MPLLGLPFSKGDHLLISNCEHPGVKAACISLARRQNLKINTLKVSNFKEGKDNQIHTDCYVLKALEEALTPRTKLVVLSHLLWNTGQLMPISKVAYALSSHQNRPYLLVDAAQSFGQLPHFEEAACADI